MGWKEWIQSLPSSAIFRVQTTLRVARRCYPGIPARDTELGSRKLDCSYTGNNSTLSKSTGETRVQICCQHPTYLIRAREGTKLQESCSISQGGNPPALLQQEVSTDSQAYSPANNIHPKKAAHYTCVKIVVILYNQIWGKE